ncbi:MAG: hypothetical protein KBA31_07445 [Alphaproteobacteria bacterium]|nr:hypothetical protein [Alphaproteobacteria bacterium]
MRLNPRLQRRCVLYAPLALHVLPAVFIAFAFMIPQSCIAGVNALSVGFAATVLGFIPCYVAGIRIAQKQARSDA